MDPTIQTEIERQQAKILQRLNPEIAPACHWKIKIAIDHSDTYTFHSPRAVCAVIKPFKAIVFAFASQVQTVKVTDIER